MTRGKRRPKPLSPKAGIKRTRYGCGGKLKQKGIQTVNTNA